MSVSKVFNPKDLSHLKCDFYAIMTGLCFSMLDIISEDIGITVTLSNKYIHFSVLVHVAQLKDQFSPFYM